MKQNKMGVAPLSNIRLEPTPREEWSMQHAEDVASGKIIDVLIPWQDAKALGLLTKLHPKNSPKCLHLRKGTNRFIELEKRGSEASLAPAIKRLIDKGLLPANFYTRQRQSVAEKDGEGWVMGETQAMRDERAVKAKADQIRQQFRTVLRRR